MFAGAKNLERVWNKTHGIDHGFVNFGNPTGRFFFFNQFDQCHNFLWFNVKTKGCSYKKSSLQ
jgi:hypothetical protein